MYFPWKVRLTVMKTEVVTDNIFVNAIEIIISENVNPIKNKCGKLVLKGDKSRHDRVWRMSPLVIVQRILIGSFRQVVPAQTSSREQEK